MPDQMAPAWVTKSLGRVVFTARWMMAPIYIGLLVCLLLLVVKFVQKLIALIPGLLDMTATNLELAVLGLVDVSLVANLVLIVVLAGWQGFVDPMLSSHLDHQPDWLALDFSGIKLRLVGSIVAIAAIALLESFMHADTIAAATIGWQLGILLGVGVVGVLLAAMDRLSTGRDKE
ncbi:MAG TPA: YqhA family protein [Acetobacteraceae bacterium]|jgi:uncharacterized protein (TIGR00645 family)|nr:YqhA family protein [Acetobacteraceae bacterium]